jgi:hypothetical protein
VCGWDCAVVCAVVCDDVGLKVFRMLVLLLRLMWCVKCGVVAKKSQNNCKAITKFLRSDNKVIAKRLYGDCRPITK